MNVRGNTQLPQMTDQDRTHRIIATQKGLANIQRDDLRGFYQSWCKPNDSALIFAGDISLDDAVKLATR